jgi:Arc/MetJ-type ribon-helix-helix transcriptional regulator
MGRMTITGPAVNSNGSANGNGLSGTVQGVLPLQAQPDAWTLAAGTNPTGQPVTAGYDPDKFYVQGTDARGHKSRMSITVPPDVVRQIAMLIEGGDFPAYEVTADFVRDAIVHHLHNRGDQVGDLRLREANESFYLRHDVAEQTARMRQALDWWTIQEDDYRQLFTQLVDKGAWGQLWQWLRDAEEVSDPMPEPFRTRIMVLIGEFRVKVPVEYRH